MSSSLLFCKTCGRPYTKESSYKRHISYCLRAQSRPRVRQRSCRGCSNAKTKCDFQLPCNRCTTKGLDCIYENSAAAEKVQPTRVPNPLHSKSGSSPDQVSHSDAPTTSNESIIFGDLLLPQEKTSTKNKPLALKWTDNDTFSSSSMVPYSEMHLTDFSQDFLMGIPVNTISSAQTVDRCAPYQARAEILKSCWTDTELFLHARGQPHNIRPTFTQYALVKINTTDPVAQNNAGLILQTLRSFPRMMSRRETFPGFIHPRWNRYCVDVGCSVVREPIITCMNIAKMFINKSYESKEALWDTIRREEQGFADKLESASPEEVLASIQASCIYILIRFVDDSSDNAKNTIQMLVYFQIICERFRQLVGGEFFVYEHQNPSNTWDEWIFQENRRRLSIIWFLITNVVGITTGIPCGTAEASLDLPLPAHKSIWEARSYSDWENEYVAVHKGNQPRMTTFGELIDAHKRSAEPYYAQLIDNWNAGIDGIGHLINLAMSIV